VQDEVGSKIAKNFILPISAVTLLIMGLVSILLWKISEHITEPIIYLYEKICDIIKAYQKNSGKEVKDRVQEITLSYKPKNMQINRLYLAFSKLTKSIEIARSSLLEGNNNLALIGYHEVAEQFEMLGN